MFASVVLLVLANCDGDNWQPASEPEWMPHMDILLIGSRDEMYADLFDLTRPVHPHTTMEDSRMISHR